METLNFVEMEKQKESPQLTTEITPIFPLFQKWMDLVDKISKRMLKKYLSCGRKLEYFSEFDDIRQTGYEGLLKFLLFKRGDAEDGRHVYNFVTNYIKGHYYKFYRRKMTLDDCSEYHDGWAQKSRAFDVTLAKEILSLKRTTTIQKQILYHFYCMDEEDKEIGKILGQSEGFVTSNRYLAVNKLSRMFGPELYPGVNINKKRKLDKKRKDAPLCRTWKEDCLPFLLSNETFELVDLVGFLDIPSENKPLNFIQHLRCWLKVSGYVEKTTYLGLTACRKKRQVKVWMRPRKEVEVP